MKKIVLEVSPLALPVWRQLPHCVRWHVGEFPLASPRGDAAEIANHLATAFPQLVRRVVAVIVDGTITVRLACEGVHEGVWGYTVPPTHRRVTFEEEHEIVTLDGRIVSDQIALDLSSILRQLRGHSSVDPDETARMGKANRESHERARR
jgi:SnoaL-like polyketide cyclase